MGNRWYGVAMDTSVAGESIEIGQIKSVVLVVVMVGCVCVCVRVRAHMLPCAQISGFNLFLSGVLEALVLLSSSSSPSPLLHVMSVVCTYAHIRTHA